ncbi:MAG: ATP-binding protein [Planctomycetota bacterium]|jgi:serine/threonine-protein kinase RsbW
MTDNTSDRGAYGERLVLSLRRREEFDRVEGRIMETLGRCGFDAHACFAIRTALEEALSNAALHGNRNDPAKALTIEYTADASAVAIVVEDEGVGFDPAAVPDPTRPENVDIPSGRGIMLMRAYMTEVEFDPPGNRVRMTFKKKAPR